ncbi:MAG TPA: DUF5666 domain-containing protein [Terracidiphilus sp.]|jgi:hypothetical protein
MSIESIRKSLSGSRNLLSAFAAGVVIFAAACGGMNQGGTTPPGGNPQSQSSMAQIKIGDDPADRLLSFEVSVGPITLAPDSGGAPITVLSGNKRVELTHLSGTSQPISLLSIPQGSYKAATVTLANPEVTFLNSLGKTKKLEFKTSKTITINFSPSIVIGTSSAVVGFDVNLSKLLVFDANGNVIGVNITAASFTVNSVNVAPPGKQHDDDGELEDTTGTISAVNGSSFTLTVADTGASLTFTTDSKTEFEDGASLAVNAMVTVEGVTNADGSLYAKKIEGVEDEQGSAAEGLITVVTGDPASALTVVADEAMGSGTGSGTVGSPVTIHVSNAKFQVKQGDVDTSGLGNLPSEQFPFDASSVHAGQRVEIESQDGMSAGGVVAEKVRLQQQALVGKVSGLNGPTSSGSVTFTLTLPADSAFAMLSGQTQVTIFWQPGTNLQKLGSVSNGDKIRVRGLVFDGGTSFNMIAARITK